MTKFRQQIPSSTKTPLTFLFLFFLGVTQLLGNCPPYLIPEIPTAEDYASKVYIDPSAAANGNGTIASPLIELPGTLQPNTAYLIKRGTTHPAIFRQFDSCLVGSYGSGNKPVINGGFGVESGSSNSTIRDLDIVRTRTGDYQKVFDFFHANNSSNIIVAYNKIRGLPDGNGKYPQFAIHHAVNGLILFNNEIYNVDNNGWWLGNFPNVTIVRNWMYNVNRGGENTTNSTGDGIQIEYGITGMYMAGNIIDKSNSIWKYGLMLNGTQDNNIVEYNTFYAPKPGQGGAAVRWVAQTGGIFKKNLVRAIGDNGAPLVSAFDTWSDHANKPEPYGIRDNHILLPPDANPSTNNVTLHNSNLLFRSIPEYSAYLANNPGIGLYGSDINPLTFLTPEDDICGVITPQTYTIDLAVTGNGTVTLNPNKVEYEYGDTVELTATADEGWTFSEWSGSVTGTNTQVVLTMNEDKSVTATFQEEVSIPETSVIQSASGTNTVTFSQPPTAGNLLVAVLAHRSDPTDPPNVPEGFTLREEIQFKTDDYDRHGVLICDKISDGTETSFNLMFGSPTNDLGGIVMELDIQNATFFDANSNTSGNEQPASFSENVPQPTTQYLSVAAAVSRNAGALTSWNNGFVSPTATLNQVGAATRLDLANELASSVTVQNSGEQGAIIVGSWLIDAEITPTFTVTTSTTGNGTITLNPQKPEYEVDESVQITATPDEGWQFVSWQGDLSGDNNPASIIVDQDKSIQGVFQQITYQITASANPSEGGEVSGTGTFASGETALLTATPADGYVFENWTENGNVVSSHADYSFNVTGPRSLVANFSPVSHTITLSANPTQGGTVSGGGSFQHGQSASVSAAATEGYSFVNWTENGTVVSSQANYSFTVTSSRNLIANFSNQIFTLDISPNPSEGGTTTGAGNYIYGQTANAFAVPAEGYNFVNWTEDGIPVSEESFYTFTMSSNRTLVANFSTSVHTVQASALPSNGGTVSGGGDYNHGQTATLNATANNGYFFVSWSENGVILSDDSEFSFVVTNDRNLTANFSLTTHQVSLNASPTAGGNVFGSGNYYFGQSITVNAVPNNGYSFENWTENGIAVSSQPNYSFSVNGNSNLTANFTINTYDITAEASPTDGGTITGPGTYEHGENVTLTATPANDFVFLHWQENGAIVSTQDEYSFQAQANRQLTAVFSSQAYNISLTAIPLEGGTLTGEGLYEHGQSVTVGAQANEGYEFLHWIENGEIVSNTSQYTFTVDGDRSLEAVFEGNTYVINAIPSPDEGGFITGTGTYNHGETAVLVAEASSGYTFINWTENGSIVSTSEVFSFPVEQNHSFTAHFSLNAHSITAEASPAEGGSVSGTGNYEFGTNATLSAIPSEGFDFIAWKEMGQVISNESVLEFTVNSDRHVVAEFERQRFLVNLVSSPADAAILDGAGHFYYGETATVEAQPQEGYIFDFWTINGVIVSEQSVYNFTVVDNQTLVAHLSVEDEDDLVVIDAAVWPQGYGWALGGGTYQMNQPVILNAQPMDDSFKFIGWYVDDELVSTETSFSFSAEKCMDINAVFDYAVSRFEVHVQVEEIQNIVLDTESIQVFGSGIYEEGEVAALEFAADDNVEFIGWRNAAGQIVSRRNPYEFEVHRDTSVELLLKAIEDETSELQVFPNPSNGRFRINFDTGGELLIYDNQGVVIESRYLPEGTNTVDISGLPVGIYLLHLRTEEKVLTTKVIIN